MRNLAGNEQKVVSGGVNPHLIAVNPGGQSNKSTAKNPICSLSAAYYYRRDTPMNAPPGS